LYPDFYHYLAVLGNIFSNNESPTYLIADSWLNLLDKAIKIKTPPLKSYYGILKYLEELGGAKNEDLNKK